MRCRSGSAGVLDVRRIAPKVRHPKIFESVDALEPGASLILANDHDPTPLLSQFTFERAGSFRWRYLEEGPEVWRVEIGKAVPAITPDLTVGHVAHHYPETLEAMKALGVNHCCGAQLTLTEAAAAAGVPVETLLEALAEAQKKDP